MRSPATTADKTDVAPPHDLKELFFGFFSIGVRAFGGVMPWAYRAMVEERRWLTPADFAETIGLCQFLPGPNIGNASIVLGKRWFGFKGSIVAFLGLFTLPFVCAIALVALYGEFASSPIVRAVVTGVGVAGAGLMIGTAVKLGKTLVRKPAAIGLVGSCFLLVGVGRLSMLYVLPLAVVVGTAMARREWL